MNFDGAIHDRQSQSETGMSLITALIDRSKGFEDEFSAFNGDTRPIVFDGDIEILFIVTFLNDNRDIFFCIPLSIFEEIDNDVPEGFGIDHERPIGMFETLDRQIKLSECW